jgi:hypothetical protein
MRPGKGRVLVATAAFDVGALVLRERPLLVWEAGAGASVNYLAAFSLARAEAQAAILQMFHPPVKGSPSPRFRALSAEAPRLAARVLMEPSQVCKLLLMEPSRTRTRTRTRASPSPSRS